MRLRDHRRQKRRERRRGKNYVYTTNHTLEDGCEYMLVDSGFSGNAVVGLETLGGVMRNFTRN